MSMTRIQRRRMLKVIEGGKRDATVFDLAFAPIWFWLGIMGVWK